MNMPFQVPRQSGPLAVPISIDKRTSAWKFKAVAWGMTSTLALWGGSLSAAALEAPSKPAKSGASPATNASPTAKATDLAEVEVTAAALGNLTEGTERWTTESTTGSTRLPLSRRETPQSVSVMTDQQLKDRHINSLHEAMRDVVGVTTLVDAGAGRFRFDSRGFAMQNFQQDGVNVSSGAPGANSLESALDEPDMAIYDHIEVLRGASGLTQGNGTPGGSVNLVRKRPTDLFQASTSMTVGSWGLRRNEVDLSGPIGLQGRLRGRTVILNEDRGTAKSEVDSDRSGFFGALEYDLGERTRLGVGMYRQRTHSVPDFYGVPFNNNGQDLGLPRSDFLGATWNQARYDRLDLFTDLTHDFDNGWHLEASLNHSRAKADVKYTGTFGGTDEQGNRVGQSLANESDTAQRWHNSSEQTSLNINANGPFSLLGRQHELVIGADVSVESFSGGSRIYRYKASNIYDWMTRPLAEPDWNAPTYASNYCTGTAGCAVTNKKPGRWDDYALQRQQAVYATGRFSLHNDVKLILGSRVSEYDSFSADRSLGTQLRDRRHAVVTPYAGVTWDFADNWTAYASYTDVFEPQTVKDPNGRLLEPIVGKSYETGVKTALFNGTLEGSIALFRIDQANREVPVTTDICQNGKRNCSEAGGLVRSQGLEMEIAGTPVTGLRVGGGYTYNDIDYAKDEFRQNTSRSYVKGERANSYTPRHILRLYSQYQLPGEWQKWSVGTGVNMQSGTESIKPFNLKQGGYTLWDASISYRYSPNLEVALIGNNLTDKRYYQATRARNIYGNNFYGEPRNFALRATLRY